MDEVQKLENANKHIRSVTNIGIGTNIGLSILKITVGIFGHSIALIADGIHSVSDIATDIAVLLGVHFGSKAADSEHPYGHGRLETFAAAGIALALIFVGLGMVYKASIGITELRAAEPGLAAIFVAIASIITKEWLYRITRKIAVSTHSSALYANAWHHRSDALSSVAVVVGIASVMLGFKYGDHIAATAVGLMIALVGGRLLGDCFHELSESAVDLDTIESIRNVIDANVQIRNWHKLRTRMVGREVFLDLHILVDPSLNIANAHEIAESLENTIHRQLSRPVNITVHIEPDMPELRK